MIGPGVSAADKTCWVVRLADAESDNVDEITNIVNDAYRVGEAGILVDTPERPLQRATKQEILNMIQQRQLLILVVEEGCQLVGCIKVARLEEEEGVGELGCLAVKASHEGKGYGRILFKAAEGHMRSVEKCTMAQLEVLAPSKWKHEHKERLRRWYLRMGYSLRAQDDYEVSTMNLPEGSHLGERFVMATDCDFTYYRKQLHPENNI